MGGAAKWEALLHLRRGELGERLTDVFRGGSIGTISEREVEEGIGAIMGMDRAQVDALIHDLWEEYLGTLNVDLAAYFAGLRPRYRTGILSNSFVGAREKEQGRYGFGGMCDLIIYSHEEGMQKPDPRFYALACARLGVQPMEVVFLDDVEGHVAAARACGIHAVRFTETTRVIADIEAILKANGQPE